jgi:hypothetical protein
MWSSPVVAAPLVTLFDERRDHRTAVPEVSILTDE